MNSQALPVERHVVKCPKPVALASSTATEFNTEGAATVGTPSEPTIADKDFFMALACLAARRSKDPHRQVNIHAS